MNRIVRIVRRKYLNALYRISPEKYKKKYPKFLRDLGIQISPDYRDGGHGFIHPTASFDGNNFSLISIGKNTTISADVVFLTHDYSITKALHVIGKNDSARFLKPISIGDYSFVGMRTIILPGSQIGSHVIIGAGSVISGTIPDNVVVAGNPAKVICQTDEWAKKHIEKNDFDIL